MTQPRHPVIVTVNGGSSSIKISIAADAAASPKLFSASLDRIGTGNASLNTHAHETCSPHTHALADANFEDALAASIGALKVRIASSPISGIGHRIVHGGPHLTAHQLITPSMLRELAKALPLDPTHLPREMALIEGFAAAFPNVAQVACFDTVFHREMPLIAQLLPVPRRYMRAGLRHFGFHGLSYASLMEQLVGIAGPEAADGRVILAHLGAGASMAAVRGGTPIDTTMSFTPLSGLSMATRPGNLDPGFLIYLLSTGALGDGSTPSGELAGRLNDMLSTECGLLGISEISGDMRELQACRVTHAQANDAIDYFCYEARKHLCALAGAMGGVDIIVFSGGIGERSPEVRAAICHDLAFLGVVLEPVWNARGTGLISGADSRVSVRVIATDEERTMADIVRHIVGSRSVSIHSIVGVQPPGQSRSDAAKPQAERFVENAPPTHHQQTVAEAKDAWRSEGNPN
ncbi:MAG: acetate/propionate family kinase [Planctomycetota bacterium]|nr:acetate/propionate family kinase [Planctomycetota bacterium]